MIENFLLGEEGDEFTDRQSFLESGMIDSTGILELITHIEDQYEVDVEDEEMIPENLDSIERIARFVVTKVAD